MSSWVYHKDMKTFTRTVQHGERGCYTNHGCRRPECREANRVYLKEQRERRKREGLAPDDPRHGSDNGYVNWGCRCDPCGLAHSEAYYHSVGRALPAYGPDDIRLEDWVGTSGTPLAA